MRNIYGTPVLTLTEAIEQLMILQGNAKRNHYMEYLLHGQKAWKTLLRKTVWSVKQKVLTVVDGKVTMPEDISRMISLSVVDCHGNLQPIGYNPNINTLQLETTTGKCSCKTCDGVGTLCGAMDVIQLRTEDIEVGGQTRTKRIWNRTNERGDLEQVTEVPVYDPELEQVTVHTIVESLCKLEVTTKGCIAATAVNRENILRCCGCYIFGDCPELLDSPCGLDCRNVPPLAVTPYENHYGQWKWEANSGDTIHLHHSNASSLILTYQSDGECEDGEVLIPEYAQDAFNALVMARQMMYNPAVAVRDKEYARGEAERQKTQLMKYLNPIRISTFVLLQGKAAIW